jgi:hypothetical protein
LKPSSPISILNITPRYKHLFSIVVSDQQRSREQLRRFADLLHTKTGVKRKFNLQNEIKYIEDCLSLVPTDNAVKRRNQNNTPLVRMYDVQRDDLT